MRVFPPAPMSRELFGVPPVRSGLTLKLIILFTVLTVVLTTAVIIVWEQVLRPPYYGWIARQYPGPENADNRYKLEQRGEHFLISIAVDLIVVSTLLSLFDRQQKRLAKAREKLERIERVAALGRMAAQVAHEVRNPLAGLLLYSQHLRGKTADKLAENELQLIDKIIETINNLSNSTEQILNYARPVNLSLRPVNLNEIATDVIQLLKTQIATNGIETRLNLSDSAVSGMLDEASIRAALLNLGLNAVQAMPEGGSLAITTGSDRRMLWMEIRDSGHGMTPEEVKRVFEPFNTSKRRGLGLGMSYAQKVIEQHGGEISVQSERGKGTRIRVELPPKPGVQQ